jgi:hypothetical protein
MSSHVVAIDLGARAAEAAPAAPRPREPARTHHADTTRDAGGDAMPGFAAIVAAHAAAQPLGGARIACTLPLSSASAALAEALQGLGAALRWMPDPVGEAGARHLFDWPGGAGPNLLLEHGAAASRLIHAGTRREDRRGAASPERSYSAIATGVLGASESAASGARWLARCSRRGLLLHPATDCSEIGRFDELSAEAPGLRTSAALSLLLLSQIDLFQGGARALELSMPSRASARLVAMAHDTVLREQIGRRHGMPRATSIEAPAIG